MPPSASAPSSTFTPFQSRYTAYLAELRTHWAHAGRTPGRNAAEKVLVRSGFVVAPAAQK